MRIAPRPQPRVRAEGWRRATGTGASGRTPDGQAAHGRWAVSPTYSVAAPATCPVVLRARIRRCRFARLVSHPWTSKKEATCDRLPWMWIATSARSRSKTSPGCAVDCCLREVDFLDHEDGLIERELACQALSSPESRRCGQRSGSKASNASSVTSASSPNRWNRPTGGWSRTGSRSRRRAVRVRHGGAHLQVIFVPKRQQRGRDQPQNLRL